MKTTYVIRNGKLVEKPPTVTPIQPMIFTGSLNYVSDLMERLDSRISREMLEGQFLDEGCGKNDCPAAGGSGEGCKECWDWWDRERREVR